MRRNHRAIKTMAWPFNAFPVTFTRHCSSSVAVAVYSFFKKLPFGDIWRNELNPFIIWFQQICYNKAAPCSSQLWWIAACKTKGERELLLMRLLWSATHPRRLGVERLNALAVLFENRAKQNKKDRSAFVWHRTSTSFSVRSHLAQQFQKRMNSRIGAYSSFIYHFLNENKTIFASCTMVFQLKLTQAQFGDDFLFFQDVFCVFLSRKTFYTRRRPRIAFSRCFSHIINDHSQYFQAAVALRQRKMPPHLHGVRKEMLCLTQDGLVCVKRFPS